MSTNCIMFCDVEKCFSNYFEMYPVDVTYFRISILVQEIQRHSSITGIDVDVSGVHANTTIQMIEACSYISTIHDFILFFRFLNIFLHSPYMYNTITDILTGFSNIDSNIAFILYVLFHFFFHSHELQFIVFCQ